MAANSRSAKFYSENKASREKKQAYDKKLNSKPEQVKKRVEANKKNRDAQREGTAKKNDKMDYDHATNRFVSESKNRGRKGEGGRKKK